MLDNASHHVKVIDQEIELLQEQVATLKSRIEALRALRTRLQMSTILEPGERITKKSEAKYKLLVLVTEYLQNQVDKNGRPVGAETRQLFNYLVGQRKQVVNYNTFRSYLTRFKDEQRLTYNYNTGRWFLFDRQKELFS